MQRGLPLPYFESEGLEDGYRQYHECGTDEADTDGFFVTFVHTAASSQLQAAKLRNLSEKGRVKRVKFAPTRLFLFISTHIHDRLSQTRAEYPRYLEG